MNHWNSGHTFHGSYPEHICCSSAMRVFYLRVFFSLGFWLGYYASDHVSHFTRHHPSFFAYLDKSAGNCSQWSHAITSDVTSQFHFWGLHRKQIAELSSSTITLLLPALSQSWQLKLFDTIYHHGLTQQWILYSVSYTPRFNFPKLRKKCPSNFHV